MTNAGSWYWWFAWRPIETQEGRWVWGRRVLRRLEYACVDTPGSPGPWSVYTLPVGFVEPNRNCTYPEIGNAYR